LKYFPVLAACKFAGGLGLVAGIWRPAVGVPGAFVLVIRFVPTTRCGELPGELFMKTSGIAAALPAQDLDRAKNFYVEKVGLQALESRFLLASDGQVGLTVGDGTNRLYGYPARAKSSGEFTAGSLGC
jgi:hypothetical protein